MPRLPGYPY